MYTHISPVRFDGRTRGRLFGVCPCIFSKLCVERGCHRVKTTLYIDGFNLYYSAVKDTPLKWLNPVALAARAFRRNQIVATKYFSAKVSALPRDPDQPTRQMIFWRALRTLPQFEIILQGLSHPHLGTAVCRTSDRRDRTASTCGITHRPFPTRKSPRYDGGTLRALAER